MSKSKCVLNNTGIAWTEKTLNPLTGCSPISAGCKHCYAKAMAEKRLKTDFSPRFYPERLEALNTRKGYMIFMDSMTDMFYEGHDPIHISMVFQAMRDNPQHIYQILTKRPEQAFIAWALEQGFWGELSDNIWLGVTVENNATLDRLDTLRQIPAKHKFVSFEPLLEAIHSPDLTGIDWVIAGGETGTGARPCDPLWISDIWQDCVHKGIPFFHKQWGRHPQQQRIFDTLPEHQDAIAAFRQFPVAMAEHLGREL